jgi:uncharacterized membrane protein YqjE
MTATETEDGQLPTFGRLARRTAATVAGALQNRAELFTLEFEEENDRLLKMAFCAVGGLLLAMLGVLLITGIVIFVTPEQYRVYTASGFAALYLMGAGAAGLTIKKLTQAPAFAESLKQLRKDTEILNEFK